MDTCWLLSHSAMPRIETLGHVPFYVRCRRFFDFPFRGRETTAGNTSAFAGYMTYGPSAASWPRAKYFPFRPDLTQSISILSHDHHAFTFIPFFLLSFFRPAFVLFCAHFQRANNITPFIWEASKVYLNSTNCKVQNISMFFERNNLQGKFLFSLNQEVNESSTLQYTKANLSDKLRTSSRRKWRKIVNLLSLKIQ